MLPVVRSLGLLRSATRRPFLQRAHISAKPAKEVVTPAQQAVALGTMFVIFLIPSGWILAHLEDYKHRPEN
ncbi:hypothetical protein NDU88_003585 [Pleurodeles waltl]|uniref:Uncharacterized protein n=1 Tax=Pleurodeles waltl TaxID=8319 RepID=A0AAV7TNT8_PLEWA|nr:hypothetical protein NDU88_003585 [Pleurodeles waltl]